MESLTARPVFLLPSLFFLLPVMSQIGPARGNPAVRSQGPGDRPAWVAEQAAVVNYLAPLLRSSSP